MPVYITIFYSVARSFLLCTVMVIANLVWVLGGGGGGGGGIASLATPPTGSQDEVTEPHSFMISIT